MKHGEQVDAVEPRPSALNMTLPAFAAERGRLQEISIDDWYTVPAAIDRPAPALSSKLAACRCCCRSTGQTDVLTDGRTPERYTDPAPRTTRAASITVGGDGRTQHFWALVQFVTFF